MKNKKNNEELQSRRQFFKQAAKGALPIIAATVLASAPAIVKAAQTPMDCYFGCAGSCYGSCSAVCAGSCSGGCQGSCQYDCLGSCKGGCDGTCKGSCGYSNIF